MQDTFQKDSADVFNRLTNGTHFLLCDTNAKGEPVKLARAKVEDASLEPSGLIRMQILTCGSPSARFFGSFPPDRPVASVSDTRSLRDRRLSALRNITPASPLYIKQGDIVLAGEISSWNSDGSIAIRIMLDAPMTPSDLNL